MSESGLRWILLFVGIIILAIIYVLGKRSRTPPPRDLLDEATRLDDDMNLAFSVDNEPEPNESLSHVESLNALEQEKSEARMPMAEWNPDENINAELAESAPLVVSPEETMPSAGRQEKIFASADVSEKIIILHVASRRPAVFDGTDILQAASQLDLEFDVRGILHRPIERSGKRQSLFNIASMVKPGLIPMDDIENFATPGLSLFLQLPGPEEGLKSFNAMWDCAQGLAALLGGDIEDQGHKPLSPQTIDRLREEIQLFSLRQSTSRRVH